MKARSIIYARISDNVLDDIDWPVRKLVLEDGRVVEHEDVPPTEGAYPLVRFQDGHDPCTGWTSFQLLEWSRRDYTGYHPERFHDLKAEIDEKFASFLSPEDFVAMLHRGS